MERCLFKLDFCWENQFDFDLHWDDTYTFDFDWGSAGSVPAEKYEGPYEAFPDPTYDQAFLTKDKLMEEDMIFRKIPYTEASNPAGGNTVTIG